MVSTARALPESKNTSTCHAHKQGLWAEAQVIEFCKKQSYQLLAQRLKTPYAEVDLLFRHPHQRQLLLVEVKSLSSWDFIHFRLSKKQKQRLLRAHQYLYEQHEMEVVFNWAFVTPEGEITLIEGFFD